MSYIPDLTERFPDGYRCAEEESAYDDLYTFDNFGHDGYEEYLGGCQDDDEEPQQEDDEQEPTLKELEDDLPFN